MYRDLLRCSREEREMAVRYFVRRGIPEALARALSPAAVADYARVARRLRSRHGLGALARAGVLSPRGRLIFYRHRVLLPVRDEGRLLAVAGRSYEPAIRPATLLPRGVHLPVAARRRLRDLMERLRDPRPDLQLTLGFG